MRTIFILLLYCVAARAFAQTPFQGKIVYNLHIPKEKTDISLITYFGNNKLRLEFAENGQKTSKDYVIIAFDEGTITTIDSLQKRYRIKNLRKDPPMVMENKSIAGYKTSPVNQPGIGSLLGGFFGQAVFHLADELYFPIPEEYRANPELMMLQNGRVVLGAEIRPRDYLYDKEYTAADSVDAENNIITAEAVELVKHQMDPVLFQIPSGFTAYHPDYYKDSTATSVLESLDSAVIIAPPQIPLKKKKPAPANKKTTSQKSPAYRRKNG